MAVFIMFIFILWVFFVFYQVRKINKALAHKYSSLFDYLKQKRIKNTSIEDNKAFDNYIKYSLLGFAGFVFALGTVFIINDLIH